MKIAIVHEMLVKLGWAEKVVEELLKIFPTADLFTLIYDEKKTWSIFPKSEINSQVFNLFTQKLYKLTKKQRFCLPFMSRAIEQLDFSGYDIVIASSSGFAHWAITKPETKIIVYYHSPCRYIWDWTNEYKKDIWWDKWLKWYFLNKLFKQIRQWDYIASKRVDIAVTVNRHVQKRIEKYYRRYDSKIIAPCVDTKKFIEDNQKIEKKDYYITIAALTEWKRLDIAIKAFNKMSDKKLKIIWVWNYEPEYKKMSSSNNIDFLGYKDWKELIKLLKEAKWFIFCSEDDFGIAPIEAMACWLPVLAYSKWWTKETILPWITWEHFNKKDWSDFIEIFQLFNENIDKTFYDIDKIIEHSKQYDNEVFERKIKEIVFE